MDSAQSASLAEVINIFLEEKLVKLEIKPAVSEQSQALRGLQDQGVRENKKWEQTREVENTDCPYDLWFYFISFTKDRSVGL